MSLLTATSIPLGLKVFIGITSVVGTLVLAMIFYIVIMVWTGELHFTKPGSTFKFLFGDSKLKVVSDHPLKVSNFNVLDNLEYVLELRGQIPDRKKNKKEERKEIRKKFLKVLQEEVEKQ